MRNNKLHSILSLIFTFTLLFPIGISFAHSFDNHQFENCGDQLQFHSHEHETNCSVYHYNPNYQTLENNNLFSAYIPKEYYQELYVLEPLFVHHLKTSKQLRAPPIIC